MENNLEVYQKKYITSQGERWDQIALAFYGDSIRIKELMAANPMYRGTLAFPAGCELTVPVLETTASESLPPWKR